MKLILKVLASSFLLMATSRAESSSATRFLRSSLAAECSSDDDCRAGSQYCSGGLCQEFGFCRDLSDCLNPSNVYNSILCVGYVDCVNNQCGVQCSSDVCPKDQPVAECLASPCSVTLCPASTTCVDYYCGGCNALCFDSKGDLPGGWAGDESTPVPSLVEEDADTPVQDDICKSDADCKEGGYCADGTCLELGSCGADVDCFNPSNIYPVIECTGRITCNAEKVCQRICGKDCPDDAPFVRCFEAPCEATSCDEEYVSCIDDYCGGCNAIFYNAQGTQVCTSKEEIGAQAPNCLKLNDCSKTGSWFSRTMCSVKNAVTKARCAF
ncbi:hypothetical protein FisN_12Lh093 [Fistulifera solaris]|uniref:Uncharacterized protein n=1 Tax=Fistulifera solaris TaxID=1519565 RepID=A0A1Z5JN35_FISSO|nr:hypothetical protein FisN_12Lh093 [Fistulifera solaris]|eukprot:GAX15201.1 hypothetical protein FisN_12Lh093 [Fistulifera solaris]